jgi:hemolysin III
MTLDLREPVSALSHGAGMFLALPVTWILWQRCGGSSGDQAKRLSLLIFGISLAACYGASAVYHGAPVQGEALGQLRRLDHVGIYLLIAGTYTPGASVLMSGSMRRGTLLAVWSVAAVCSARVWLGGVLPIWISTAIYLGMGWGVLFCYRDLARNHGHRRLMALPLGGAFYSIGAVLNLLHMPVLVPGTFGSHELFHFFVLAGTACHIWFMRYVVIPTVPAVGWGAAWTVVPAPISRALDLTPDANGMA